MVNVSLPEVMQKFLEVIVRSGHFTSKSDVLKEAFRLMIESKPNFKTAAAVQLYKEKMPIGQIAEITEINVNELKKIFKERGIEVNDET